MSGSVIVSMIAGVFLMGVAFAHAVGPAIFLLAITPFDAIPFMIFGFIGNAITFVPILILLARTNPAQWGQLFFGSRIQVGAAALTMALLFAHVSGIMTHGWGEILDWLRFVTLFLLLAVFAWALQKSEHILTLAKVAVTAMVLLTILSAMDFYLGVQLLPLKVGDLSEGALLMEQESYEAWRFSGSGLPVNRYANYLLTTIFLALGWFMSVRNPIERVVAISFAAILVFAELLSVSRSGLLGLAVGVVVLLPMALGVGVRQVIGLVIIGGAFGLLIQAGLEYTAGGTSLAKRFEGQKLGGGLLGRIVRWKAGILIWADSPFFGVGWGHFAQYSGKYVEEGGLGAHNGYLRVLAEGGLLAFIPMAYLYVATFLRLVKRVGHLSPALEFWRPYFLCSMVAQLIQNFFNDYFAERYMWFVFAFAVAIERLMAAERARVLRERQELVRNLGARRLASAES